MANVEFGTGKSVFILTIVAACFAILWPKIFYPMLTGSPAQKRPADVSGGCCDVLFETDVDAIRVLSEMCGRVTGVPEGVAVTPKNIAVCRAAVLDRCDIDIATFLNEQAKLGHSYRQILDELRSFNTSVCLRRHFGVSPGSLGAPRRMRTWGPTTSRHLRQERPPHLRPDVGVHPALRERGRAIPASHIVPKVAVEREPGIKPPLPGMRPPMGGAGHVVPPPKTGGTMSIVMPLYTIGIVIFFMYTVMKLFVRKSHGDDSLRDFQADPEFRQYVFAEEPTETKYSKKNKESSPPLLKALSSDTTRLGWKDRDTKDLEIDQLRRRLEETERAMERIVAQMGRVAQQQEDKPAPGKESMKSESTKDNPEKVSKAEIEPRAPGIGDVPSVKVVGVETRARAEGGVEWKPPPSPTLGLTHSRPSTPVPLQPPEEPHNIFLEGSLPSHSKLLVQDAATELLETAPQDPAVILSGKMTLSLISVDDGMQGTTPIDTDLASTLHDIETAAIDSQSNDGEQEEVEIIEEGTHFTTANTAANISATTPSGRNEAEADDTAADVSAQDFLDDQEDLQDEYDAIWGALEMEDDGAEYKLPEEKEQENKL